MTHSVAQSVGVCALIAAKAIDRSGSPRKARRSFSLAAFAAVTALALSGCSLTPNVGLQKEVGIGAVSTADLRGPGATKPAELFQDVEIRTEIRRAGVAISGAVCQARSSAVSLEFTTPARISLPLKSDGTPPLTIRCEHAMQGVATAVLRPGVAPPAEDMIDEIFGVEAPQPGRYLRGYTLKLVKRQATVAAPPPALAAALEIPAVVETSQLSALEAPHVEQAREWPQVYPNPLPRPRPRRSGSARGFAQLR